MALLGAGLQAQRLLVANEGVHGKHRDGEGDERQPQQDHRCRHRRLEPGSSRTRQTPLPRDPAECEEHRICNGQVGRAAPAPRDEEREHREIEERQDPPRPRRPREEPEEQPREPQGRRDRVHGEDLIQQEFPERDRRHLLRRRVAHELERGPAVPRLPQHVRQEEGGGDRPRDPRPGRGEPSTVRREQQADQQAAAEPQRADLVQEPEAQDHAEDEPVARGAGVERLDQHQDREGPEEEIETVHGEVPVGAEEDERERGAERREDLGVAPAPEPARDQPGEEHGRRSRERRHDAQGDERVAEGRPHHRQDRDRERRMLHVAPVEVLGAGQVVELVAEVPVARDRGELEEELPEGDGAEDQQIASPAGRCFRTAAHDVPRGGSRLGSPLASSASVRTV